jgi:hypothetical protein
MVEVSAAGAATCCHLALWWNGAIATGRTRVVVLHATDDDCESAPRTVLEDKPAEVRFLVSDAGHLRSVASIVKDAKESGVNR